VVRRVTGELAGLAERAAGEAEKLLVNARRTLRHATAKAAELAAAGVHDAAAGRRRGRLRRAVNDLADLLDATRRITAQTRRFGRPQEMAALIAFLCSTGGGYVTGETITCDGGRTEALL
jgi:enoyl-[acyl-carrier-protein] reductase (NADH)